VLMFFFFFPSRFSLTIQGFSALLYLAIRSILTSTSLLFLLLSYLASFLFFLRCVKSFKIPVSCKEKPHDFCVFLFSRITIYDLRITVFVSFFSPCLSFYTSSTSLFFLLYSYLAICSILTPTLLFFLYFSYLVCPYLASLITLLIL